MNNYKNSNFSNEISAINGNLNKKASQVTVDAILKELNTKQIDYGNKSSITFAVENGFLYVNVNSGAYVGSVRLTPIS